MLRKLPPLHALAAFEAVARHQSFARAAEELHLTHSAVSHRIRQLEAALDTRLFLRLNRSVVLTTAGAAFVETVRDILHRLQEASARVASGGRSAVRASVAPGLASEWLAHRITDFQSRHPDIDLEIQSTSQMVNLRAAEVDVGIRFGDGQWQSYHCVELLAVAVPGLRSGRLVRVLQASARPKRAYYAVCLPEKLSRPEVRLFMDWLRAQAQQALG